MTYRNLKLSILMGLCVWTATGRADSALEFQVEQDRQNSLQPVFIKNGVLLVKAAGGDKNLDILYERQAERLVLIDHRKRHFTPVTDESVGRMVQQAEELQPVLRGIGEQLGRLSPKQREKWQAILGGVSLDGFEATRRAAAATTLAKTGIGKQFAGIRCEQTKLLKGKDTAAEVCLADPSALKLPEDDAATLGALVGFTQRLARQARGLGEQFGMGLPADGFAGLAGIPLELRDFGGGHPRTMTLSRVGGAAVPAADLRVPEGYRARELTLWR